MIVIADSGSTKCAWSIIKHSGEIIPVTTSGMNPFFRSTDSIFQEISEALLPLTDELVDRIYFYGAGIINAEKGEIVGNALSGHYANAKIELHSDVVAASRALFGSGSGIACILGTGSNACLFDGNSVVSGIPPLGFILGDEGSGAVLGKKLLGDYFKEVMPQQLRNKFQNQYLVTKEEVQQKVYREEKPSRYLASFAPFLSEEMDHDYIKSLVKTSFQEFFERNVCKIPDFKSYPIGFSGSVAFYFQEFLLDLCHQYKLNCVEVIQEPMSGLIKFHTVNQSN